MAKLALNLLKHSLDAPVANAAVVTVSQIADEAGRFPETPFEISVPVPAGPTSPLVLEVPDGRYTLTARTPNGASDRRTVVVGGDPVQSVSFDTGHSAREWLSWQTLAGSMPPSTSFLHRSAKQRSPRPSQYTNKSLPSTSDMRGYLNRATGSPEAPQLELYRGSVDFNQFSPRPVSDVSVGFAISDIDVRAWQVSAEGAYPRARTAEGGRPFAQCATTDAVTVAMLPLPWPFRVSDSISGSSDDLLRYAAVDVLLDESRDPGRAVRLTLREPEFLALLSYLGAGRMTEASAALGGPSLDAHVTRLLQDKIENPLAATGAAYVGLATSGDETMRALWAPWLRNLMDWFPDLPDGAILFGRDRIERARTTADLLQAKDAFLKAFGRGVPLYAAGFQQLLNGLQVFADPEDQDLFDPLAHAIRDTVARMAAYADPTQPFTVLTFPEQR